MNRLQKLVSILVIVTVIGEVSARVPVPRWLELKDSVADSNPPDLDLLRRSSAETELVQDPEAANYNTDRVGKRDWCVCYWVCVCYEDRRKRSVFFDTFPVQSSPRSHAAVFGSRKELELYDTEEERHELEETPVALAELVSRPLDPSLSDEVSTALGGKQYAVIITLNDDRKFLVVKGNQKGKGSKTVLIPTNHITDNWVKEESKDIEGSKVIDYINAGGDKYDLLQDNGTHAALRMMKLN